jgi:hypothetical protein
MSGAERPRSRVSNSLPGGYSEREPPDPIPNSEVKTLCADGSVPFRHARVGHCQALIRTRPRRETGGASVFWVITREGTTRVGKQRDTPGSTKQQ